MKTLKNISNSETEQKLINSGREVITIEADAIRALAQRIDQAFVKACELILSATGRTIVTGMGKSGHIAKKIAATLASTGTPAFYVHPGEAGHGDFGMITHKDVIIALSHSGETPELLTLLPLIKHHDIPLISITGNSNSTLAKTSDALIDASIEKEACPLNLAPTASTSVALAWGDALAIALLKARGFTSEDFARSHPSGNLGRRLLLRIRDIMRTGDAIPTVFEHEAIQHVLIEMTQKHLGMTTVINQNKKIVGIFTDGDLRRTLSNKVDVHNTPVNEVMTPSFKAISQDSLAASALDTMEMHKITCLLVLNDDETLRGVVHMHDLLSEGIN